MNTSIKSKNFICSISRRFCSESAANRRYPKSFREWLAGVTDGDGHIGVSNGYPRLVLTVGLEDRPLLEYLTGQLQCGNIYNVKGAKAVRYLIQDRAGMKKVIHFINGHIRNSVRLPQLRRVCNLLDIPFQEPLPLDATSNWFAGFFDSDGSIGIHTPLKRAPELRIGVTNKHRTDLEAFQRVLGGNISYNRRDDTYQCQISSRKEILRMLEYYHKSLFLSRKSRRFRLIEEFFQLKDERAHRPDSIHYSDWLAFLDKWKNFQS